MADAEIVAAARGIVDRVRDAELERRGLDGQDPSTGSRAVGRSVRRTAIGEIEVAIGLGAREAGFLITAATAPGETYGTVDAALRRGEVAWRQVRELYEHTATLDSDQRSLVASVLLGSDPEVAAADRLDPDGELHGRPWSVPRYHAALEAEVMACKGTDVEAERAARARAYEARHLGIRVHGDGTATMHIRGPVAAVTAAGERIERGARAVRALGDPRTLDQLRVDIALGVLMYATIALGDGKTVNPAPGDDAGGAATGNESPDDETAYGAPSDETGPAGEGRSCSCSCGADEGQGILFDELIAPDDMELLSKVVNALPPVTLQVVVPYATLAGGFPICAHCSGPLDATRPRPQGDDDPHEHHDTHGREHHDSHGPERRDSQGPPWSREVHDRPGDTGEDSAPAGDGNRPADPRAGEDSAPAGDGNRPTDPEAGEDSAPAHLSGRQGDRRGRGRGRAGRQERAGVAEVLGAHPFFISDGHARELALMPGTTLFRLVADLRDGRLVERTIKSYKPDAQMRRQVVAADVHSRAPGARVGPHAGELDHVLPHGWAGGPTGELNLALLAKRPHQYKTDGLWQVEIGARRDLTFTTLLGQVVRTRAHDYRTYLDQRAHEDLDERRDQAGQLLLAALADEARSPRASGARRRDWVTLDHTDPLTGQARRGPHPGQPTLEELLDQQSEQDD